MSRDVRIALYGDIDLNVIDGSAIWLQSLTTALSLQARNAVTLVCKQREKRDLLTGPLRRLPGVTLVNPVEEGRFDGDRGLSRNQALDLLEQLDAKQRFDIFILRGFALCHAAAIRKRRTFAGRLWPYLTDIPQTAEEMTDEALERLEAIANASRYLLCQTEALRSHLESWVPAAAGKSILLEPMIPDQIPARSPAPSALAEGQPFRLIYVGKYAPMWNTYEMTTEIAELRAAGFAVELHMVGDKIHRPKEPADWADRMERALTTTPGVHWHKGRSRDKALAMLSTHDLALGWRDPALDSTLELSTKLLEYGAVGIPALINRTAMHEELLGTDYPLYANSAAEFKQAIIAARDPEVRQVAVERCARLARSYRFSAVAERLQTYIDRAVPVRDLRADRRRPLRVLLACHDFKFFNRIQEHLAGIRGLELRVDAWAEIDTHDPARSQELLEWADMIICEWCTNNAIWYSQRKRPGQVLIVRLHRFELYGQYVKKLKFDAIDRVVFVGDFYRDEAMARLGWPLDRLTVIPNWVDTRQLDRPKTLDAVFNLGMIGVVPKRKRLDRGLAVLEKLRAVDDRFQLHVKSKMTWEYPWIWARPDEQDHTREIFSRINGSPLLQGAVQFDGFGGDVSAWLRKIGFVLSTSDDESFHLAPAEGMASRALPMLLPWKGADAIYPSEWIHADDDQMAAAILATIDRSDWVEKGEVVREYIESNYSVERVCAAWEDLVVSMAGS
ncbi:MAG TPA: glycosyltransferase [Kofleriaceae bacterium]|nr:glycosyltransferase [Kofleriaceae bacterium]